MMIDGPMDREAIQRATKEVADVMERVLGNDAGAWIYLLLRAASSIADGVGIPREALHRLLSVCQMSNEQAASVLAEIQSASRGMVS